VGSTPLSAFFKTLLQGTGRGMGVNAKITHVVDGPALTFLNHQHFILPALTALF
jgi:hypothetical protein